MDYAQHSILVVDDTELYRQIFSQQLANVGYHVATAVDGQHALETLHAEDFDLVLLDIEMPVKDGYQTLAEIKASESLRDIPVIMFTTINNADSVLKCISLGASDYISKPANEKLLRARIWKCLLNKKSDMHAKNLPGQVLDTPAKILIAEDYEMNRELLARRITSLGHIPLCAEDGLQALRAT